MVSLLAFCRMRRRCASQLSAATRRAFRWRRCGRGGGVARVLGSLGPEARAPCRLLNALVLLGAGGEGSAASARLDGCRAEPGLGGAAGLCALAADGHVPGQTIAFQLVEAVRLVVGIRRCLARSTGRFDTVVVRAQEAGARRVVDGKALATRAALPLATVGGEGGDAGRAVGAGLRGAHGAVGADAVANAKAGHFAAVEKLRHRGQSRAERS
jgi:hypothetical protein